MTYKQILIDFLQKKHKLFKKYSKEPYLLPEDIKEIEDEWSENEVRGVLNGLGYDLSSDSCPWCIFYRENCTECSYRERHGRCGGDDNNTWDLITGNIPDWPKVRVKINILVEKVKEKIALRRFY